MATISNIVKDSAGNLLAGTATIDLIVFAAGNAPTSFQGFVDLSNVSADFTINVGATVNIVNGTWTASVKGNAAINDSYGASVSTFYRVTELTNGISRVYFILVPNDNNSYWAGDLIAIDPGTVSNTITLDSLSDVDATSPSDKQVLQFDTPSGRWKAVTIPALTGATYKDVLQFSAPGTLQAVTGTMAVIVPYAFTITGVYLHVDIPSAGAAIICDAKIQGNTVFSNVSPNRKPRIAIGANVSTLGVPGSGDTPAGSAGNVLSLDINQVGSTLTEGTDLTASVGVTYG